MLGRPGGWGKRINPTLSQRDLGLEENLKALRNTEFSRKANTVNWWEASIYCLSAHKMGKLKVLLNEILLTLKGVRFCKETV